MDAEGSELLVLRGAEAPIRRSPELRILMEWSPAMLATRSDPTAGAAWLAGLSFRFWWLFARVLRSGQGHEGAPLVGHTISG
jgi:hypothetical protein